MSENNNETFDTIDNAETVGNTEVNETPVTEEVTEAVTEAVETSEAVVQDVTETAEVVEGEQIPEYATAAETLETAQTVFSEKIEPDEPAGEAAASFAADEDVPENSKILGTLSLILGILSVTFGCCGFCFCGGWFGVILSVSAVVLGIVSLAKHENAKGMAIAGIVCGGVGVLLAVIIAVKDPVTYVFDSVDRNQIEEYVDRIDEIL